MAPPRSRPTRSSAPGRGTAGQAARRAALGAGPDGQPDGGCAPGHVPTPPPLAAELAEALLGDLGDLGDLDVPGEPARPRAAGVGPRAEFLDPACGAGALLAAALSAARRAGVRGRIVLRGLELDPGRAEEARRRLGALAARDGTAEVDVRQADALDPELHWPRGAVLANPPWASLSGRRAVALDPARATGYRAAWTSMAGWPSLHGAFLERIARHVAEQRVPARVLLPASLCELAGYGPARRAATAHAALAGAPQRLAEDAFPGVVGPGVIVALRPAAGALAGRRASDAPWTASDATDWVERLRTHPRLPAGAFGDPGVHTGNAARELIERERPDLWPGVREGRDLSPFALAAPRLGLRTDLCPGGGRRFRVLPLERYRAVPVLVRQTADRPVAALHEAPGYFRNTLLACLPPPELDPAFCVAVLNGPVAAAWHRARFADARQAAFPQVKVRHLRELPFPIAARREAPRLHDRVVADVRAGRWRAAVARTTEAYGLRPAASERSARDPGS